MVSYPDEGPSLASRTYNSLGLDPGQTGWRWDYEKTVAFQGPVRPLNRVPARLPFEPMAPATRPRARGTRCAVRMLRPRWRARDELKYNAVAVISSDPAPATAGSGPDWEPLAPLEIVAGSSVAANVGHSGAFARTYPGNAIVDRSAIFGLRESRRVCCTTIGTVDSMTEA